MKNKLKVLVSEINEFLNADKSLIIFILLLLFNFVYIFLVYRSDLSGNIIPYVDTLYYVFTDSFYLLVLLFNIFISIYITFDYFDKNLFVISRCENRKGYFNKLTKKMLINVTIVFLVNLLLALIIANLKWDGSFGISQYCDYNINNLQYFIFYIIRMYIIVLLLAYLSACIVKLLSFEISLFINVLILFIQFLPNNFELPILYTSYLGRYVFNSFGIEFMYSIVFIFLFAISLYVLRMITLKFIKCAGK